MSRTYVYVQRNGCGTLTLSALNETDANDLMSTIVSEPEGWRLDSTEDW